MSSSFEDIAIVDLDLSKTTWSRVHSAMRTLYLRLSHDPEVGWVKFFHEERESRVVLKRHGLWIEDGYIVFDCLLEDVDEHHLPDFRLSVQYANQKYRELLAERRDEGVQMRNDARVEQLELAMLRARIRSGSPAPVANPAAAPPPPTPKPAAKIASPSAAPAAAEHSAAKGERKPPLATPQRSVPPRPSLPPRQQTSRIDIAAQPAVPTTVVPVNGAQAPLQVPTTIAAPVSKDANADLAPKISPATATAPPASTTPASTPARDDADFDAKREEWRARFRAAYASSRPKEPSRGND
jgi:hypothetical protein